MDNILSTLIEDVRLYECCLCFTVRGSSQQNQNAFVSQRTAENMFGIFIGMRQDAKY